MSRVPVFAANWKMNKALADVEGFVGTFKSRLKALPKVLGKDYQALVCPTALHLPSLVVQLKGSGIEPGAQNCGQEPAGAFTGEISPVVLKELGCPWVILGHSERRHIYGETDGLVAKRLKAALDAGLNVIFCVGEKLDERRAGKTFEVVNRQLQCLSTPEFGGRWGQLVVAYEPVWAIGTGETATPAQAQEVHAAIRKTLGAPAASLRILYGGSANAGNSKALMEQGDVDGLLVGGASLDANTFGDLVRNGLGLPA